MNEILSALARISHATSAKNCLLIETSEKTELSSIFAHFLSACEQNMTVFYAGHDFNKWQSSYSSCGDKTWVNTIGGVVLPKDMPQIGPVMDFGARVGKIKDVTKAYIQFLSDFETFKGASEDLAYRDVFAQINKDDLDLVVIDGASFVAHEIVQKLVGAKSFVLRGTKDSFGGSAAFEALFNNPVYELVHNDDDLLGGTALFALRDIGRSKLPIHFFTIVLNGQPFIRYHEKMMSNLKCDWHWHVVEGVADLVKDTAWSVAAGGHIPQDLHHRGKSNDGTTEYLDDLKSRMPDRVTIYRKPDDVFWNGKQEMVSAPIPFIEEDCILWQIDGDELWSGAQVETMRQMFLDNPEKTSGMFWCNYFVGPEKLLSTRYGYAQNPNQEWQRVWRFKPGMKWDKHEPPVLARLDEKSGETIDVGKENPFTHYETEKYNLIFDHFAYVTPEQARFKESYYGYTGAVDQWRKLQQCGTKSGLLRDYFAWVNDDVMFDSVENLNIKPLAYIDAQTKEWEFRYDTSSGSALSAKSSQAKSSQSKRFRVLVDGVFFQLANSGIARVWVDLLTEWVQSGFIENVILLDRGGTAPRIEGVIYHSIKKHNWDTIDGDAIYLQEVCDRLEADLFVSSYYTTPTTTPSIFTGYDMIPEVMGADLGDVWWQQKRRATQFAAGYTWISQSSANDMYKFHPYIDPAKVRVIYISIAKVFKPIEPWAGEEFKKQHNIDRDFILLVGERLGWKGYKNATIVLAALSQMPKESRPLLVCVGGVSELDHVGKLLLPSDDYKLLKLDDEGLRACYGAALAYVCPSKLEGFGLPIGEAMSVGCPAIVCNNSSIPEVAGAAGIYFDPDSPASFIKALTVVNDPILRAQHIAKGFEQVKKFDQAKTAQETANYYLEVHQQLQAGKLATTNSALADSFKHAQALHLANEKLQSLDVQLGAAKLSSSQSARIGSGTKINVGGDTSLSSVQMLEYVSSLEYRLAYAVNEIRYLQGEGQDDKPSSNQRNGLNLMQTKPSGPPRPTIADDIVAAAPVYHQSQSDSETEIKEAVQLVVPSQSIEAPSPHLHEKNGARDVNTGAVTAQLAAKNGSGSEIITDFDAEAYLLRYPEVAALGMNAREHYQNYGARLGYIVSKRAL